jgi:hypothetical protein
MNNVKTHNTASAIGAKFELRTNVLEYVRPSHVFDAYCGHDGEMYKAVWREADSYLGCDTDYVMWDPRHRMVCDNLIALRALDLQRFNVFDCDAFSEPWPVAFLIAARRTWKSGEMGAIVLTNGFSIGARFYRPTSLEWQNATGLASQNGLSDQRIVHDVCVNEWIERSGVRVLKRWIARGMGTSQMLYDSIVFEGE